MHRNEANIGLVLYKRLGSVAVMYVPVDDQDALHTMALSGIKRGDGDIAEEAEAHGAGPQCVVAGRAHRAEAPHCSPIHSHVDAIEQTARGRRGSIPRTFADNRIGIEMSSPRLRNSPDLFDVARIVGECELFGKSMAPFDVLEGVKEGRVIAERARN
jgi:hypothetical protein